MTSFPFGPGSCAQQIVGPSEFPWELRSIVNALPRRDIEKSHFITSGLLNILSDGVFELEPPTQDDSADSIFIRVILRRVCSAKPAHLFLDTWATCSLLPWFIGYSFYAACQYWQAGIILLYDQIIIEQEYKNVEIEAEETSRRRIRTHALPWNQINHVIEAQQIAELFDVRFVYISLRLCEFDVLKFLQLRRTSSMTR